MLFGDKAGTYISQKNDDNVGGQKYVSSKLTRINIKSSHVDGQFVVIGLATVSGNPAMTIIIFTGKELTFEQRTGHHIRVRYEETESIREISGP